MAGRFAPGGDVLFQDLDEEVVLLHLSSGVYYGASAVGARVWKLLLEGKADDEIVAQVASEYEVAPDQASADVAAFLADLQRHNLVKTVDR